MVKCRLVNETDRDISEELICACVRETVHKHGDASSVSVNVVAVLPDKIRDLNKRYNAKSAETDVLTFEADNRPEGYLGEIVINPAYLEDKGSKHGFEWELCHVVVHGTFHLLGVHHEDGSQQAHEALHKQELQIINAVLK